MMDFLLGTGLYSWIANHSNYIFPYISSLLVRALVFFVAILILFGLLLLFSKMSQIKKKRNQKDQANAGKTKRITDLSKKTKTRICILTCVVLLLLDLSAGTTIMTNLGQFLFRDASTHTITKGDFNWIELDSENELLYAVGHGTDQILAFHTDNLNGPTIVSEPLKERAQSFAINYTEDEIYYPTENEIIVLNVPDLQIKDRIEIPTLSPGDVWILWDEQNNQMILSSEADENTDNPFLVIDRKTGDVLSNQPINAWNLYLNPNKPILYLGPRFEEKKYYLYDTAKNQIVNSFETGELDDRMILDENRNELLIAAPSKSRISRYDPMTFEWLGSIPANWGVRSLAIDRERNLLFAGSLMDNTLIIIDLNTYQTVRKCWIGPWIRSIVLDTENRLAYVSTKYELVSIDY